MAAIQKPSNVTIENARLVFRNFKGERNKFGSEDKTFGVVLPNDAADEMEALGWNIKQFKPRPEDEPGTIPDRYIIVKVGWESKRPPSMVLINSNGRKRIDPAECDIFDWVDIQNADLIINAHVWENAKGESGVKAYLTSLFITVNEDELEAKYRDVPFADEGAEDAFLSLVEKDEVPF